MKWVMRSMLVAAQALAFAAGPLALSGGCGGQGGEAREYPPEQSPQELELAKQMREFDTKKRTGMTSKEDDLLKQMRNFDKKKGRN